MNRRLFLTMLAVALGGTTLWHYSRNNKRDAADDWNQGANSMSGGNDFDWQSFLAMWSSEVIELLKTAGWDLDELESEALAIGYLSYAGANGDDIVKVEQDLGITLPPSYKAFLTTTNGWRQIAMDAQAGRMFSVSEIAWFKDLYPQSLQAWLSGTGHMDAADEAYFVYGDTQDPVNMRDSYLEKALAISEEIDAAVYLLNPEVVDENGEWEAWFFSYELPGALRYRSFQEMMQAEYLRVLRNLKSAIEFSPS